MWGQEIMLIIIARCTGNSIRGKVARVALVPVRISMSYKKATAVSATVAKKAGYNNAYFLGFSSWATAARAYKERFATLRPLEGP